MTSYLQGELAEDMIDDDKLNPSHYDDSAVLIPCVYADVCPFFLL